MSARLRDLTLAELAQRSRRYRPLVLTIVVTLGILRVLPEPASSGGETVESAAPVAATVAPPAPVPTTAAASGSAVAPEVRVPVPAPVRTAPPAPRASAGSAGGTSSTPIAATPSSRPSGPVGSPPQQEPPAPTVVATGWATRAAGTPAGDVGVPDGSLPVGNSLGQTSKASFARLAGDWQTLSLQVDPEGTSGIGAPSIQACAITTESWEPRAGAGFDEAPAWGEDCVAGVVDATGVRWKFEIGDIDQRFGIALVPAPDAPVEFQIAFRTPD